MYYCDECAHEIERMIGPVNTGNIKRPKMVSGVKDYAHCELKLKCDGSVKSWCSGRSSKDRLQVSTNRNGGRLPKWAMPSDE